MTAQPAVPDDTASDTPTIRDLSATVALAKVGAELFDEATADTRAALLTALLDLRTTTGAKSLSVDLPGVGKVATISLTEPKDRFVVTDNDAFISWIEDTQPQGTIDYQPVINSAWLKQFTEQTITLDTATGEVKIASETGEITVVPGTKAIAAADPTSFSLRWDAAPKPKTGEVPKLGGKQKAASLLTGDTVTALLAGPSAPTGTVVDLPAEAITADRVDEAGAA